jgi:hypothetical protein
MNCCDGFAWDVAQPIGTRGNKGRELWQVAAPLGVRGQGLKYGVTGEFGVSLPDHFVVWTLELQKIPFHRFEVEILNRGELPQVSQFRGLFDPFVQNRHIRNQRRQFERGRGACVNFVVQHKALRIISWQIPGYCLAHTHPQRERQTSGVNLG